MATDRSLATLLRALQSPTTDQDASRLLGSATTLLTLLSNPLNVALLTSQILTAPAIWQSTDTLQTSFRVLGAFNAAALQKMQYEEAALHPGQALATEGMKKEDWVTAVVKGADNKSHRWKHMLVLGGLLTGFEGHNRHGLPSALRRTLETAMVKATNLALSEASLHDPCASSICTVLGQVFDLLGDAEKSQIHHHLLLPLLVGTMFFNKDGLHWGYFLGMMEMDVVQSTDNKFDWSCKSSTYIQIQKMASRPVITSLGALSRLAAFCLAELQDIGMFLSIGEKLLSFTRSLCVQWLRNKLSEVDVAEESLHLSEACLKTSLPLLWRVLNSALFAVVVLQSSIITRIIRERMPLNVAPDIAIKSLHVLRNLYFISSRLGRNPFTQYTFVHITSVDIISQYPLQAEGFLRDIHRTGSLTIAEHPHERCLDLYFLNTAEFLALCLPPAINEELLIRSATPYLGAGGDFRLLEIFEAAHSVMLAVFACPQNYDLLVRYLDIYIENIFHNFPQNLSSRQFRLAIKSLVRITSPLSKISQWQPLLSSTLLELVHSRIEGAATQPLPSPYARVAVADQVSMSEKSTMVMTLIDSLPSLSILELEEWLPLIATSINALEDQVAVNQCRDRLWEVMSNGEMDITCSEFCVIWWNTRGGRDMVLQRSSIENKGPFMSGALGEISKL